MPYIDVEKVEESIAAFYETISLKQQWIDKIVAEYKREMLARETTDYKQRELANKRIEKLQKEKIRITKAYISEAIDLDILKAEKDRINQDMKEAEVNRPGYNGGN